MNGWTSRKFLAGLAGTVLMFLLTYILGVEPEAALAIVSPLILWVFGEAYVDRGRTNSGEK